MSLIFEVQLQIVLDFLMLKMLLRLSFLISIYVCQRIAIYLFLFFFVLRLFDLWLASCLSYVYSFVSVCPPFFSQNFSVALYSEKCKRNSEEQKQNDTPT